MGRVVKEQTTATSVDEHSGTEGSLFGSTFTKMYQNKFFHVQMENMVGITYINMGANTSHNLIYLVKTNRFGCFCSRRQ